MIYKNEKLSKYSWFNLGTADILFKPNSIDDLKNFLNDKKIKRKKSSFELVQIFFLDAGFDGVIIKLGKPFKEIKLLENNKIEVGAATLDKKLADFAYQNSISGFEFLSCIPGSIGGAITMNSGCYDNDISKVFSSLKAISLDGKIIVLKKDEVKFFYRGNNLDKKLIILSVILQGKSGKKDQIKKKQETFLNRKRKSASRIKLVRLHLKTQVIKKLGAH